MKNVVIVHLIYDSGPEGLVAVDLDLLNEEERELVLKEIGNDSLIEYLKVFGNFKPILDKAQIKNPKGIINLVGIIQIYE